MQNVLRASILLSVMFVLTTAFMNCTAVHEERETIFKSCVSLDELTIFESTYHPFLKTKCSACHVPGGEGPGSFASNGPFQAFESFQVVGPSYINQRALDNHSSGSGPQNQSDISRISQEWLEGQQFLNDCQSANDGSKEVQDDDSRLRTVSKPIDPRLGNSQTITWDLGTDIIDDPNFDPTDFQNVTLTVDVGLLEIENSISYVITRPSIDSPNNDIHIESLLFKINGKAQQSQRAFYYVDNNIRAWNVNHPDFPGATARASNNLVSDGSLIVEGIVTTSDLISISIGVLETTVLPPPAQFPEVQFATNLINITDEDDIDPVTGMVNNLSIFQVDVDLSRPADEVSSVEIGFGSQNSIVDECCNTIRNDNGDDIDIEKFDRDIEVVDALGNKTSNGRLAFGSDAQAEKFRVVFLPGEQTRSLYFKIVPDGRYEPAGDVLELEILNVSKVNRASTNQNIQVNIPDNDIDTSGSGVLTYSQLMSPGGVLSMECLRCHNSVDNRGGYDMSNYWQMVNEGVLVPGSANSLMFARMNPDDPIYMDQSLGLKPMPETGFIPLQSIRDLVKDWIVGGAQNN